MEGSASFHLPFKENEYTVFYLSKLAQDIICQYFSCAFLRH